ncbi:unnamed protein product [Amoebophrya sp. A120]|nr:unnamed protein product [Amoebophrya sp. A120]|eukprot:GSA120T00020569001.1
MIILHSPEEEIQYSMSTLKKMYTERRAFVFLCIFVFLGIPVASCYTHRCSFGSSIARFSFEKGISFSYNFACFFLTTYTSLFHRQDNDDRHRAKTNMTIRSWTKQSRTG